MTTTTGSGTSLPRAVSAAAVAGLRSALVGDVFGPGDEGYAGHRRVWNGSIDRHPAIITRCSGVNDVRTALRFGRDHELPIAIRGGGHSFPGLSTCDDGLLIDLRPMSGVRVDPDARVADAQAGVLLEELRPRRRVHTGDADDATRSPHAPRGRLGAEAAAGGGGELAAPVPGTPSERRWASRPPGEPLP